MKKWLALIGTVSVMLFAVALIHAEEGAGQRGGKKAPGAQRLRQGQMMFQKFDMNQDGQIQQQEWIAVFKAMDADGNGVLSKEELAAQQEQVRQEAGKNIFQRFDKNGDGNISPDEFKAAGEQMRKLRGEDGKVRKMKQGGDPNSVQ